MPEGILFICATPIGNLGDVSERLRATLAGADVVYAEDTRRTAKLLRHLDLEAPLHSLFEGNEMERSERLIDDVASGLKVALVSDAGTPAISDPGAAAVRMALERDLEVRVIPGPSAVTAAVAASGFGGDRFVFEGFLPRKGTDRSRRLAAIAREERPVVLFVTPHRADRDFADLAEKCGDERLAVVCRELTKLHEEIWSGSLGEAANHFATQVRGELTVVLGPGRPPRVSAAELIEDARRLVAAGVSVSEASRRVAEGGGVSRRLVYQTLIEDQDPI